jgi:hypothetical protein
MILEIVQEGSPAELEAVRFKVADRKRKAVINTDQRWHVL